MREVAELECSTEKVERSPLLHPSGPIRGIEDHIEWGTNAGLGFAAERWGRTDGGRDRRGETGATRLILNVRVTEHVIGMGEGSDSVQRVRHNLRVAGCETKLSGIRPFERGGTGRSVEIQGSEKVRRGECSIDVELTRHAPGLGEHAAQGIRSEVWIAGRDSELSGSGLFKRDIVETG
jgi:hypothetical protein